MLKTDTKRSKVEQTFLQLNFMEVLEPQIFHNKIKMWQVFLLKKLRLRD